MNLRKVLVFIVVGILLLSVQSALRSLIPSFSHFCPNLVLVLVVYLALYEGHPSAPFLAFFLGLLIDCSTGVVLGPWAGASVAVFLLLSSVSQGIFLDNFFSIAVLAFVTSIVGAFAYAALNYKAMTINGVFFLGMFGESFATALFAPLIFSLMERVERRLGLRRVQTRFSS